MIKIVVKDTTLSIEVGKEEFNEFFIDSCKLVEYGIDMQGDYFVVFEMELSDYSFAIKKMNEKLE